MPGVSQAESVHPVGAPETCAERSVKGQLARPGSRSGLRADGAESPRGGRPLLQGREGPRRLQLPEPGPQPPTPPVRAQSAPPGPGAGPDSEPWEAGPRGPPMPPPPPGAPGLATRVVPPGGRRPRPVAGRVGPGDTRLTCVSAAILPALTPELLPERFRVTARPTRQGEAGSSRPLHRPGLEARRAEGPPPRPEACPGPRPPAPGPRRPSQPGLGDQGGSSLRETAPQPPTHLTRGSFLEKRASRMAGAELGKRETGN